MPDPDQAECAQDRPATGAGDRRFVGPAVRVEEPVRRLYLKPGVEPITIEQNRGTGTNWTC
ncbi:hypothetical protein [Nocardia bovistercoris]|uniref:Uncharacterized protein n=1 Tax=Nocardia bovistercoris TaxID=2785916 RepID=A0A931N203_9NOCA|nr:hypothetical protein [Nocardia bovistercoris]MBH0776434.1 hypothetical protein [Nocardia bovistercoris]